MNSNAVIASEDSPSRRMSGACNDDDGDHDTALSSSTATSSCTAHDDDDDINHDTTDNNDVDDTKKLSTKLIVRKLTHESRFLEILCSRKDTYGDVLYKRPYEYSAPCNNKNEEDNVKSGRIMCNSCEYTGKLWFMKLGGIRFREVIRILDICSTSSNDEHADANATRNRDIITLECTSLLNHNRSSKQGGKGDDDNNFVPCARVTCQLIVDKQKDDDEVVRIIHIGDIHGELLLLGGSTSKLLLLLPGKKQIVSVITSTFRDAVNEYVDELLLL